LSSPCKEILVIPVDRVMDKKRINGKMEVRGGGEGGEAQGVTDQGCQIFLVAINQTGGKCTSLALNYQMDIKIYKMGIIYCE
jgi:hypothetical protein